MPFQPTEKTIASRSAQRVTYDRARIFSLIDECLYCNVSYAADNQAFTIPTFHTRIDDKLYIHGSVKSHFLMHMPMDQKICISMTVVDGLVFARSGFHHSMNYRSVVMFAIPVKVEDSAKKMEVMEVLVNKLKPGRWNEAIRKPTDGELAATAVMEFEIKEVSLKQRKGPPKGDDEDKELEVWSGVVPLKLIELPPITAPGNEYEVPEYMNLMARHNLRHK